MGSLCMEHRILIFDRESRFVKKLSEDMNVRYADFVEVLAFDDADKLLSYLEKNKAQICLIAQKEMSAYQMEKLLKMDVEIISIVESKIEEGIFAYQPISQVAKDIMDVYTQRFECEIGQLLSKQKEKNCQVIGCYSPVRSVWQSQIMLSLGQKLAVNKRVLYVNFEPYAGFEEIIGFKTKYDMSDFIFGLNEDDAKMQIKLQSVMEMINGMYFIPPAFSYLDYDALSLEKWRQLFESLYHSNMDVLLLDLSEQVKGLFSVLEECDVIFSGYENSGAFVGKKKQYEKLISHLRREQLLEKSREFEIPILVEQTDYQRQGIINRIAEQLVEDVNHM